VVLPFYSTHRLSLLIWGQWHTKVDLLAQKDLGVSRAALTGLHNSLLFSETGTSQLLIDRHYLKVGILAKRFVRHVSSQ
jgi:hypothetical protein